MVFMGALLANIAYRHTPQRAMCECEVSSKVSPLRVKGYPNPYMTDPGQK
jgi:hypothetical protein